MSEIQTANIVNISGYFTIYDKSGNDISDLITIKELSAIFSNTHHHATISPSTSYDYTEDDVLYNGFSLSFSIGTLFDGDFGFDEKIKFRLRMKYGDKFYILESDTTTYPLDFLEGGNDVIIPFEFDDNFDFDSLPSCTSSPDESCRGCTNPVYNEYYPCAIYEYDSDEERDCSTTSVIYGCTDMESSTYNPDATVDDGSCEYPTPELFWVEGLSQQYACGWRDDYEPVEGSTIMPIEINPYGLPIKTISLELNKISSRRECDECLLSSFEAVTNGAADFSIIYFEGDYLNKTTPEEVDNPDDSSQNESGNIRSSYYYNPENTPAGQGGFPTPTMNFGIENISIKDKIPDYNLIQIGEVRSDTSIIRIEFDTPLSLPMRFSIGFNTITLKRTCIDEIAVEFPEEFNDNPTFCDNNNCRINNIKTDFTCEEDSDCLSQDIETIYRDVDPNEDPRVNEDYGRICGCLDFERIIDGSATDPSIINIGGDYLTSQNITLTRGSNFFSPFVMPIIDEDWPLDWPNDLDNCDESSGQSFKECDLTSGIKRANVGLGVVYGNIPFLEKYFEPVGDCQVDEEGEIVIRATKEECDNSSRFVCPDDGFSYFGATAEAARQVCNNNCSQPCDQIGGIFTCTDATNCREDWLSDMIQLRQGIANPCFITTTEAAGQPPPDEMFFYTCPFAEGWYCRTTDVYRDDDFVQGIYTDVDNDGYVDQTYELTEEHCYELDAENNLIVQGYICSSTGDIFEFIDNCMNGNCIGNVDENGISCSDLDVSTCGTTNGIDDDGNPIGDCQVEVYPCDGTCLEYYDIPAEVVLSDTVHTNDKAYCQGIENPYSEGCCFCDGCEEYTEITHIGSPETNCTPNNSSFHYNRSNFMVMSDEIPESGLDFKLKGKISERSINYFDFDKFSCPDEPYADEEVANLSYLTKEQCDANCYKTEIVAPGVEELTLRTAIQNTADIVLSLVDNNDGSFDIMYESSADIYGFQIGHNGCIDTGVDAFEDGLGAPFENGFIVNASATTILAFSFTTANFIPAGSGILLRVYDNPDQEGTIIQECIGSTPEEGTAFSDQSAQNITWSWEDVEEPIFGCTDPEAICNYNEEATIDDGSCEYLDQYCYDDSDDFDGLGNPDNPCELTCSDDPCPDGCVKNSDDEFPGIPGDPIYDCKDPLAINYNEDAHFSCDGFDSHQDNEQCVENPGPNCCCEYEYQQVPVECIEKPTPVENFIIDGITYFDFYFNYSVNIKGDGEYDSSNTPANFDYFGLTPPCMEYLFRTFDMNNNFSPNGRYLKDVLRIGSFSENTEYVEEFSDIEQLWSGNSELNPYDGFAIVSSLSSQQKIELLYQFHLLPHYDMCGICSGGDTGHIANSDIDENGQLKLLNNTFDPVVDCCQRPNKIVTWHRDVGTCELFDNGYYCWDKDLNLDGYGRVNSEGKFLCDNLQEPYPILNCINDDDTITEYYGEENGENICPELSHSVDYYWFSKLSDCEVNEIEDCLGNCADPLPREDGTRDAISLFDNFGNCCLPGNIDQCGVCYGSNDLEGCDVSCGQEDIPSIEGLNINIDGEIGDDSTAFIAENKGTVAVQLTTPVEIRGIELKIAGVQIYDADISDYLNYKSSIFQNTDGTFSILMFSFYPFDNLVPGDNYNIDIKYDDVLNYADLPGVTFIDYTVYFVGGNTQTFSINSFLEISTIYGCSDENGLNYSPICDDYPDSCLDDAEGGNNECFYSDMDCAGNPCDSQNTQCPFEGSYQNYDVFNQSLNAFINTCGICIDSSIGELVSITYELTDEDVVVDVGMDCYGECDGSAFVNECGVCVGGNTGVEILQTWNTVNPNTGVLEPTIVQQGQDCNGDCFGLATLNNCSVCTGGNSTTQETNVYDGFVDEGNNSISTYEYDFNQDCNGDCFGTAFKDSCNMCVGGNTGYLENHAQDCNGDCFGNHEIDECGVCYDEGESPGVPYWFFDQDGDGVVNCEINDSEIHSPYVQQCNAPDESWIECQIENGECQQNSTCSLTEVDTCPHNFIDECGICIPEDFHDDVLTWPEYNYCAGCKNPAAINYDINYTENCTLEVNPETLEFYDSDDGCCIFQDNLIDDYFLTTPMTNDISDMENLDEYLMFNFGPNSEEDLIEQNLPLLIDEYGFTPEKIHLFYATDDMGFDYEFPLFGDLTGDGEVNVLDVVLLVAIVTGEYDGLRDGGLINSNDMNKLKIMQDYFSKEFPKETMEAINLISSGLISSTISTSSRDLGYVNLDEFLVEFYNTGPSGEPIDVFERLNGFFDLFPNTLTCEDIGPNSCHTNLVNLIDPFIGGYDYEGTTPHPDFQRLDDYFINSFVNNTPEAFALLFPDTLNPDGEDGESLNRTWAINHYGLFADSPESNDDDVINQFISDALVAQDVNTMTQTPDGNQVAIFLHKDNYEYEPADDDFTDALQSYYDAGDLDTWLVENTENQEEADENLPNFLEQYGGIQVEYPSYEVVTQYTIGGGNPEVGNIFIANLSPNTLKFLSEDLFENYYSLNFIPGDTFLIKDSSGYSIALNYQGDNQYILVGGVDDVFEFPMTTEQEITPGMVVEFRPAFRDGGEYGEFNFTES